jgi:predicted GNAT family acetyltransferase
MSFCYVEAEAFLCGKCAQGIAKQLVRVAISEAARKREIKKPPTCSIRRPCIR